MPKNKTITFSIFNSRQEEIYLFLKKRDANITNLIWDALHQVYWLRVLFDAQSEHDRAHEIDELEKIEAAINTIFRLEGELVKAKLLATKMGIDFSKPSLFHGQESLSTNDRPSMTRSQTDSLSANDRPSVAQSQTDSTVKPESSTTTKRLPIIAF